MTSPSRVVVIGAGMGGLAASARLATAGHQVTVLEQADTYGGKLGVYARDGFVFDTGPSLLTLPAVYRDLFLKTAMRRTGASLEETVDLQPLDPAFRYRFPDGSTVDLPGSSRSRISEALDAGLGAGAGAQWTALIDHAAKVWQVTRKPFLETPLTGPADLLRQSLRLRDVRTVAPFTTLRGLGRRHLQDPRLRLLLDRYATYAGSDPRKVPAALSVIPYVEQTFGAWHIGGGVRRLGDALYERCVERGVTFAFGTDVEQVMTTAGRASGVRLASGQVIAADVVVANADARHVYDDLVPPKLGGSARRSLDKVTPSLSGFSLLLALRGRTSTSAGQPGMLHHTVLFPTDYDAEFDAVFGRNPLPVPDPTVYICAPDDPLMRPDDAHESWFVLVNAPRHQPGHGVDWTAPGLAESYADRVLDVMAARGLDVRDRVIWRVVRTPADLEVATRAPGGSIYGTSSNGRRAAFLRPANQSPIPGLFLVGGSAHPGGGLPLVGLSAEIVANLIGPA